MHPPQVIRELFLDRFINFMKEYKNELFDFAFVAERSIEDGIQELSDGEMITVIISYVVMFVYITISLGKFKGIRTLFVRNFDFSNRGELKF